MPETHGNSIQHEDLQPVSTNIVTSHMSTFEREPLVTFNQSRDDKRNLNDGDSITINKVSSKTLQVEHYPEAEIKPYIVGFAEANPSVHKSDGK